jgi:hypothetical protein
MYWQLPSILPGRVTPTKLENVPSRGNRNTETALHIKTKWGVTCVKLQRVTGMKGSEYNMYPTFFRVYRGKKSVKDKLIYS